MKVFPSIFLLLERKKPYVAMVFIQCVYAGMALFSKAAMDKGMNPFVFVVYRQAFATLALTPFAFFYERKESASLPFSLIGKIFLVSLLGLTLSLNLYYVALNYTTATFAAATTNLIPAITFIMAIIFRMERVSIKERHGMAKVFGSVLGVSGALVFAFVKGPLVKFMNNHHSSNHNTENENSKGEWVKGSLIMLSANTTWSLWLILQVPVMKQYPAKIRLTTLQCFFSCMQSAVWAVAVDRHPLAWKLGWDVHLLSVAYCGVIVTGITYWLQVWVIQKKDPVFTAMFTPLALIITAFFSCLLWKETLHLGSLCGIILLVGGLYGVLWGKNKERKGERNGQRSEPKEEVTLEICSRPEGEDKIAENSFNKDACPPMKWP